MFEGMGLLLEKNVFRRARRLGSRTDRKLEHARGRARGGGPDRKRREEEHAPLRIEPALAEIKKSERAQKEKQAPLFENLPDTPLPPPAPGRSLGGGVSIAPETLEFTPRLIEKKLSDFGGGEGARRAPGPGHYTLRGRAGGRRERQPNRQSGEGSGARSVRRIDPRGETIPGKSCMGLEIPNPHRQTVRLTEILGSEAYHGMHSALALALGKDIAGHPIVTDLARMPHLLVAGTTGSGKSVALNAMILSPSMSESCARALFSSTRRCSSFRSIRTSRTYSRRSSPT